MVRVTAGQLFGRRAFARLELLRSVDEEPDRDRNNSEEGDQEELEYDARNVVAEDGTSSYKQ